MQHRNQQRHAEACDYSQEPEYEKTPPMGVRVRKWRKADIHHMLRAMPLYEQFDWRVIRSPPHDDVVVGANESSLAIDLKNQIASLEFPHIWRIRIYTPDDGRADSVLYGDSPTVRPPVFQSNPAQEQAESADKRYAYNCQSEQIRPGLHSVLRRRLHGCETYDRACFYL
jgi:hypothetical protein